MPRSPFRLSSFTAVTAVPAAALSTATLAQGDSEGTIQHSSGNFIGAILLVIALFGGALYAICRSSRR